VNLQLFITQTSYADTLGQLGNSSNFYQHKHRNLTNQ